MMRVANGESELPGIKKKRKIYKMSRNEVNELFRKAERLRDYPGAYFNALGKAKAALAQWKAENPAEAAEEEREKIKLQVAELRRKALAALNYDADGMFSAEQCQNNYDALMKKADELEATIKNQ